MIPPGVIDAVKKFREENKTPPPSATLTTKARGQSNPTLDAIKDAGMRALQGVSTTLDAIPPSVDLYPGPVDNVAVMGLAGLNKGIKTLVKGERGMDEVVGAVKAVRAIKLPKQLQDAEKDLIALHNLSETGVVKANKMGGLPAPSVAITKHDIPFDGYGEISLIGDKKFAMDDVFASDVYSRRVPQQQFKINNEARWKAESELAPFLKQTGESRYGSLTEAFSERGSPKELLYQGKNSNAAKAMYLKEKKGIDIGTHTVSKDVPTDLANGYLGIDKRALADSKQMVDMLKTGKWKDIAEINTDTPEGVMQAKGVVESLVNDVYLSTKNKLIKSGVDIKSAEEIAKDAYGRLKDAFFPSYGGGQLDTSSFYNMQYKLREYAGEGLSKIDSSKVEKVVSKQFSKVDPKDYEKWLTDRFGDVYGRSYFYDNAGRKKGYDMSNILDYMTGRVRGQENFFYGAGSVKSKISPKMEGVEAVRANKGLIQPESITKDIHDKLGDQLFELIQEIKGKSEWRSSDSFGITDQIGKDIASVGTNITDNTVYRALRRAGVADPEPGLVLKTKDYLKQLKASPVSYFESKPQRAVQLDEFKGAMVPKGTDQKTVDILKSRGLKIVEYDPKVENQRSQLIKKHFGDALFTTIAGLGVGSGIMGINKDSEQTNEPMDAVRAVRAVNK